MKARRSKVEMPGAAINITSLLDVTFVLLISFMVVAPALRYDVGLKLPKVSSGSGDSKNRPVSIQVKRGSEGSEFFVNGTEVALADLPTAIKSSEKYEKDPTVSLEADQQAPWQDVAEVMSLLKANDINQISVITEGRSK
jgi:biopolymer transport protein ExbD